MDNIGLIYKTCDLAGIPFLTPDNTPPDDINVWNSIKEDTTMIFQWESNSARQYLKQLFSDGTIEKIRAKNPNFSYMDLLSIGNGAIRPAGASYRDALSQGIYKDNGNDALNDFLSPTLGYCIEENQMVHAVGCKKKIKDIQIGDVVYTKSGTSNVTRKTYMGEKDTICLHTHASQLTCTRDHKILSEYGWIEADKLVHGDHVAVRVGNTNSETYEKYKLRLIGYLIGDGILTSHNNVGFVNQDLDVINDFCDMAAQFDNCQTSISNRRSRVNKLDLYYANVKHIIPHKTPTSVAQYLRSIGFKKTPSGGLYAEEKFIPDFVFKLKTEYMLQLLGAYTDTDSCISNRGIKVLKYTTASKRLADDLVEAYRLIGYSAYVNRMTEKAYVVCVNNAADALRMLYNYSFKIRKRYKYEELFAVRNTTNVVRFSSIQRYVDKSIWKKIQRDEGITLYGKGAQNNISIKTLKRLAEKYGLHFPSYLFDDNIIWSPIVSKEDVGMRKVYDLTIAGEHNFVCENIVVHNCVYQEQVIEFLHKFCGFTMGEADVVRRHFSKKTGTETDIPIIKDGGYLSKDKKHYIKGFIKTMQDEYGVQKEEAERIIVDFLKVIMDASDYLFSKNHSDPYSWIGYICGYLRYHYPLEFITSALNIFADNEEKTLAIIAYAKEHGISIHPIKFRKSTAQYNYDKETHEIYKGIASIKYMNSEVADQLFELGNKTYISFTNLLENITTYTTINSKQLRILTELDFFSEFGDANKLLNVIELFEALHGKKNISKEKLPKLGIDQDVIRRYAAKETEKMYTGVDVDGLVSEMEGLIKYRPRTLADKITSQQERLGYIDIKDDKYSGFGVVMSVDTKYSPKLKVYSLKNGTTVECKVQKQVFNKQKLKEGQIIRIIEQKRKPKLRRTEDGEFEPVPGAFDIWIGKYKVVENL